MDEHLSGSAAIVPGTGVMDNKSNAPVVGWEETIVKRQTIMTMGIATLLILATAAPPLRGQTAVQKSAPQLSDQVLASWNDIGRKLIAMAEDFPEDKYEFKPAPESRTFAAQLLHVAGTNYQFVNTLSGRKMGPADNDPSRSVYKTKADVVAVLKKSFADGAALIKEHANQLTRVVKDPDSGELSSESVSWLGDCEHSGEHYGQLVVYYRVNGLVPPESRPRPK
jgi:uncharacterized damage-inducible protein DinB